MAYGEGHGALLDSARHRGGRRGRRRPSAHGEREEAVQGSGADARAARRALRPRAAQPEGAPLLAAPPADGLLQLFSTGNVVGAVGHEPWLSELLAWLVTGKATLGSQFEFKKGAVAHLEGEPRPGQMRLKALLTPKAMRV
jgi:hypothetical protein